MLECFQGDQGFARRKSSTCDGISHPGGHKSRSAIRQLTLKIVGTVAATALQRYSLQGMPTVVNRYTVGNIGIM
jgi:hypothetical protein